MGGINMRKILAVTMAFMLAAIVLSPALGYTAVSASKPAYSAQSGAMVKYSLTAGASAHEMSLADQGAVREASVKSTKEPYSIKMGGLVPYSVKAQGTAAVATPEAVKPPVVEVNETNKTVTVPEVNVTPKFALSGRVFNDLNSNGKLDQMEMGLDEWTVSLENPSGNVISNATTDINGTYAFTDLSAGDYAVSIALPMGWDLVSPLESKHLVTITDADVSGLDFAVKVKIMEAPEVIPTPAVPETPVNATVSGNATKVGNATPILNIPADLNITPK
jgi:uncharacterized protein (DUF2141 family)